MWTGIFVILVALSIGTIWFAFDARNKKFEAQRQALLAQSSQLAIQSQSKFPESPQLALLLAVEAVKNTMRLGVATTEEVLRETLAKVWGRGLSGREAPITTVKISRDNHWLIVGEKDHTTQLWDLETIDSEPIILKQEESEVIPFAISFDSRWLVSGTESIPIRLWNLHEGKLATNPLSQHDRDVKAFPLLISPDRRWLVTRNENELVQLWDLHTDHPASHPILLSSPQKALSALAFSHNSQCLVTANDDDDDMIQLWNLDDDAPTGIPIVLQGSTYSIDKMFISSNKHWLFTQYENSTGQLWNVKAGNQRADPLDWSDSYTMTPIAMTADNHWLVTIIDKGRELKEIGLRDLSLDGMSMDFTILNQSEHEDLILSPMISHDGRWLVMSPKGKIIRIWSLNTENKNFTAYTLQNSEVLSSFTMSLDGRWLATGSQNGKVRLWDLNIEENIATISPTILPGHEKEIIELLISPDNRWLLSRSHDGTVRLWDLKNDIPEIQNRAYAKKLHDPEIVAQTLIELACRTAGRNLTGPEWDKYFPKREYEITCERFSTPPTYLTASNLDVAKQQYEMALRAENPLAHYKAALEELDFVLSRDPNQYQAYAIKALIYRNLEDYEQTIENLKLAKQGGFEGHLRWVPMVMNLTSGDLFHARASNAIRNGDWESSKSYQETALEFFSHVIEASSKNLSVATNGDEFGATMQDLYMSAQARWAAGKFQMATIAGRIDSKERQNELLGEATKRLNGIIEAYPDAAALRYYLAEGYRKQALTLKRTNPQESERLQALALSQLRACAELGLPRDLRNPAAQLFNVLSRGSEPGIEQKILGTSPSF